MSMDMLAEALRNALSQHSTEYPNGNWKAANDHIGAIRSEADQALRDAGLWPADRRYLGNDAVLKLLNSSH